MILDNLSGHNLSLQAHYSERNWTYGTNHSSQIQLHPNAAQTIHLWSRYDLAVSLFDQVNHVWIIMDECGWRMEFPAMEHFRGQDMIAGIANKWTF